MNIRIVGSVLTIVAVIGGVTAVTFAFFSDAGTSSDNIFSSGSLDMKLTDSNETDQDSVVGSFGITNGAPGDTFTGDIDVKNTGSVGGNHVEIEFANVATEAGSPPGSTATTPMQKAIEVTALTWDTDGDGVANIDLLLSVSDVNGNGIIDLDDLANLEADGTVDFDNLDFDGNETDDHRFHIAGRYHPTLMVNEHQGDSVNTTLTFTLNQDGSQ